MSFALEILEKCNVEVDWSKFQIPGGLELSLGNDHCIRIGIMPLCWSNRKNAQAEYNRIKSAFENGNYRLTIKQDYELEIEII